MEPMPDTDLNDLIRAEGLPDGFRDLAARLYGTLTWRIMSEVQARGRPVLVGLCGPQGSGKSTGALVLRRMLSRRGLRTAILSIDDLYLTRAERRVLAEQIHPLLATRGPPGTHDIGLGEAVIGALLAGESLPLPTFDKAADERRARADWPWFEGPADVVLFEGWCVGARPQDEADLATPINTLERDEDPDGTWRRFVNSALAAYQPLFARLDVLVQLRPPSFDVVAGWRREQEAKLRERTGAGMSDAAIDRFVAHYERLTRDIMEEMPVRADVVAQLDETRGLVAVSEPGQSPSLWP